MSNEAVVPGKCKNRNRVVLLTAFLSRCLPCTLRSRHTPVNLHSARKPRGIDKDDSQSTMSSRLLVADPQLHVSIFVDFPSQYPDTPHVERRR
jgi:hypothetical protein